MNRSTHFGIGAALAFVASIAAAEPTIESRLQARMAKMNCPGALVGVFPTGKPATVWTLGSADAEGSRPMRRDMRMRIGSVSKLFVGAVVLQLVDEGVLSLDTPVSDYVDRIPNGDKITARMLGRHTSGLAPLIRDASFQAEVLSAPRKRWTAVELLAWAQKLPPTHAPGETHRYTNTATTVLGLVAEGASGRPYEELLDHLVCEPLGLTATGLCRDAAPPPPTPNAYRNAASGRWLGYGETFTEVSGYSASWAGIGGDMYSTVEDLGVAIEAFATGRLLCETTRRELLAWRPGSPADQEVGFLISRNRYGVGHDGDVPGFNAMARRQPTLERSIVVLTNLSNNADGTMPAEELFKVVADHKTQPAAIVPANVP